MISGTAIAWPLLIWTFMWDNARTNPGVMDAHLTTIARIPAAFRLLEVGVVVLLFAATLAQARRWRATQRSGITLLLCVLLVSAVSTVVGVLSGLTRAAAALQTIYSFVAPLLVVTVIMLRPAESDDAYTLLKGFSIAVALSVLVGWWQIVHLHAFGDDVHGIMRDAHHFASAVWMIVLWWIARLTAKEGSPRLNILGILLFTPAALYASNEKSNVGFVAVLSAAAALALWRRGRTYRVAIGAAALTAALAVRGVVGGTVSLPESFGHLQIVLQNISSIGFFDGYRKVVSVTADYPRILAIGAGPASYGSIKAVDAVVIGGTVPPLAARYTAESYRLVYAANGMLGSYLEESTDLIAFFVEFGPPTLCLFGAAIWYLLLRPARDATRSRDPRQLAMGRWVLLSTTFLLVMSTLTAFYGWAALQASVWPLMLVAGLMQSQPEISTASELSETEPTKAIT